MKTLKDLLRASIAAELTDEQFKIAVSQLPGGQVVTNEDGSYWTGAFDDDPGQLDELRRDGKISAERRHQLFALYRDGRKLSRTRDTDV